MKTFLPTIALLLTAISCFSQTEIKQTDSALLVRSLPYRQTYIYYNPQRPSPAYIGALFQDEAKVLPKLYAAKDFTGMQKYLDSVMQKSGGYWNYWKYELAPHIFCVQTLLAIETHQFSMASLNDSGFNTTIADVARVMRQMNRRGFSSYLAGYGVANWDGLTDHFISFKRNWANDLLSRGQLNPNEALLCKIISGEVSHPVKTILANKDTYPALDSLVVKSYKFNRKTGFYLNFLVSAGAWSPDGNLKILGNHASLGYNLFGLRDRWNEYDLYFASRFIKTPNTYKFVNNDTSYAGSQFYSGYYGLDYTRYIVSTPHFELGVIAAIGVEDLELKDFAGKKSTDIASFSPGLGGRINYFFTNLLYIGASAKYSWLDYQNAGGTNFQGNGLSADIYFGVNILTANKGKKQIRG